MYNSSDEREAIIIVAREEIFEFTYIFLKKVKKILTPRPRSFFSKIQLGVLNDFEDTLFAFCIM